MTFKDSLKFNYDYLYAFAKQSFKPFEATLWSNLRDSFTFILYGMFEPPTASYLLCVILWRSNIYVHRLSGFHARWFLQSKTCMNQGECWTWNAFVYFIYFLQIILSCSISKFYSILFYFAYWTLPNFLITSERMPCNFEDMCICLATSRDTICLYPRLSGSIPGF